MKVLALSVGKWAEGGSREIPGYMRVKDDGKVELRRSSTTYVLGARGVVLLNFA